MVGARRAGPAGGSRAGGRAGCAQGRLRAPLAASLAAAGCPGINRRLIPCPLLFMLRSRGTLRACAAPPPRRTASPRRRRIEEVPPLHLWPAPGALVEHAHAWGRAGRAGQGFPADRGRRMRMEKSRCLVHSVILSILKGPAVGQSLH